MSTLYIRLPSKAAADSSERWNILPCPFALVSNNGVIEREGSASPAELFGIAARAQRTVLLLAASDVSLLRVKVPPMSAARLRAALPNLVEDQLVTDPAECVFVAGPEADGMRTVAVVQRAWLELLVRSLHAAGVRHVAALPGQLCLHWQADAVTAAVSEQGDNIDLTLRLSEHDGIGLPIMPEQPQSAAHEVLQTILALVPQAPIILYAPQAAVPDYKQAASDAALPADRIRVVPDSWQHWTAGARTTALDLVTGLGAAGAEKIDWRRWRWPLVLGGLLLALNIVALDLDWWRMKKEAESQRATMIQIYKTAFPKDTLIVDPLAQMQQKIAAARRGTGQLAPDDFITLAAKFGEAWQTVAKGRTAPIAGLEYKERALFVRLKPEGQPSVEQMRPALAGRGLTLTVAPSQAGAVVWEIRSSK